MIDVPPTFGNHRGAGKSRAMKEHLEAALNAGRTVYVVSAEGVTIQKRHKHLTSITPLKGKK